MKLLLSFFLFLGLLACQQNSSTPDFSWVERGTPHLEWADSVGALSYPNKNICIAISANDSFNTKNIQDAIDSCASLGGGVVTLLPGKYLTGAIFIKSGVNLHLSDSVTLIASQDIKDYPELPSRVAGIEMTWPSAVLNIIDAQNAAISGNGRIDCRGEFCWNEYWKMRRQYEQDSLRWIVDYDCKRVRGILVSNSQNITLQDFTISRTGFWGIQVLYSKSCTLNKLTIRNNTTEHGPSTDGIDIDSSKDILIENCDIDCNDDNICLKAGRDADGLRVNRPTEQVVIRNCIARRGAGLITCGSETSGGIRNILAYNLKAQGTSNVLRLKSAMNRGGICENIYMCNVEVDSARVVLAADLNWNPSYSYSKLPDKYKGQEIPSHWTTMLTRVTPIEKGYPHFRNVFVSNITAKDVKTFISASGKDESLQLENFQMYNITASAEKAGTIRHSSDFSLKKITLHTGETRIKLESNNNLINDVLYE